MGLALVGVSHHDVPLSALDELSRDAGALAHDLMGDPMAAVQGAVVLSTCNRVELYVEAEDPLRAADVARDLLLQRTGDLVDVPAPQLGADVARHLFSVAAGLESMIVGEDEISGQVRRALTHARHDRTTSPSLERLFQAASSTSRRVAATTGLGAAGRSIVSVGLDLVEDESGSLENKEVLLIGTGAFARVVHAAVLRRGSRPPMVFSLSGRAQRFTHTHGGVAISQAALVDALHAADLVVACSGAPHVMLDAPTLAVVTEHRETPLPVLDLALTPDVDGEARVLPSVRVIDLEVISRHAPAEHGEAVTRAHRLVNDAVETFEQRESERGADAVVVALRDHVFGVMGREVERARRRLPAVEADMIEACLRRFAGELLHEPTTRARQFTREGFADEFDQSMRTVFGLEPDHTDA